MIKKVAVFGDSWAYSSWKKLPEFKEELSEVNFQKLFVEKNIVANNLAITGGTNLDTIEQMKRFGSGYDLLIVFQTDPIRQFFVQSSDTKLTINPNVELPEANDFEELCELTLKNFYEELSDIHIPILLVGGCTKLCYKHVPAKIKHLSKSWTELMVPDFTDHYFYWVENTLGLYEYARKKFHWDTSLSDFFQIEKQILMKNHIWQTSDDFSWCHPSDSAYYAMFEEILGVINDYS
jgi:hypothetical protein